jgi:hypothetical protein
MYQSNIEHYLNEIYNDEALMSAYNKFEYTPMMLDWKNFNIDLKSKY